MSNASDNICTDCDPDKYLYVNTDNLEFKNCSNCNLKLCNIHYEIAVKHGKEYGYGEEYAMCDQCCWFQIG